MAKALDLTGQRFGKLTVINRAKNGKNGNARWNCVCDCGKTVIVPSYNLRSGKTQSCGCIRKGILLHDLSGQRFGKLVAVKRADDHIAPNGDRKTMWLCKCDCGKECIIGASDLKSGHTKSCGCGKLEICSETHTKDIAGERFGRLVVIKRVGESKRGVVWECQCDCGNKKIANGADLRSGRTRSCGCLEKEVRVKIHTKHGLSKSRIWKVWNNVITRCYNEKNNQYKDYGGRGIRVCDEWLGEHGFENFANWAYSTGFMEDAKFGECTIERIDVNGDYSPLNCCWATQEEQANNKRNNIFLTYGGKTQTIAQWSRELGMNYRTLYSRIRKLHWTVERAFKTK